MWRFVVAGVCLALPWIQPFTGGPSASVVPWLASASFGILAFALLPAAVLPRAWLLLASVAMVFVAARPDTGVLDRAAFAGGCALVLLACAIGRTATSRCDDLLPLIAGGWIGAALLSSVVALLQYFDAAVGLQPWVYGAPAGEAMGNLRQRNQLASLTGIGLAALVWLAARYRGRFPYAAAFLAVLVMAAANAATTSRTGMVEWAAILVLGVLWRGGQRRERLALAGAGLAAYAAAAWMLPILLERVTGVTAESLLVRLQGNLGCSSRRVLWDNVLQLTAERPWLGWGWGELDYAHYMHLYGDAPRFCDILDNAHNLPLHVAVELGIPAALLLSAWIVWLIARSRPDRETDGGRQLAWTVLLVIALHSLLEYPLWYGPFQLAFGLALGLLASRPDAPEITTVPQPLRVLVATVLMAFTAYASWNYLRVTQIYLEPERRWEPWKHDALEQARCSRLFAGQALFAELTLSSVTRENGPRMHALADRVLHYSPEPRVIERAIESAAMIGRNDEAVLHLARYRAAFPREYRAWRDTTVGAGSAEGAR